MKVKALRKPQWYQMRRFFDGPAKTITPVNDANVILQGVIYEANFACPKCGHAVHMDRIRLTEDGKADLSPQLGVCLIPQEAISNQQGEALRRMLEANLRMPVVLLSDNIQLVELRPIHQATADRILGEASGESTEGRLVSFPIGNISAEPEGGARPGAADNAGSAGNLGAEAPQGDGGGEESVGNLSGAEEKRDLGEGAPVGVDEGAAPAAGVQHDPEGSAG